MVAGRLTAAVLAPAGPQDKRSFFHPKFKEKDVQCFISLYDELENKTEEEEESCATLTVALVWYIFY